jgi:hypothetical protein
LHLYVPSTSFLPTQSLTIHTGLFSVTIRQALFIAPCSHTFHYKCIRPLLESHHPAFSCPLCRTFANLEEDVEVEVEEEIEMDAEADEDSVRECGLGEIPEAGAASSPTPSPNQDPNQTSGPVLDNVPSILVSPALSSVPTMATMPGSFPMPVPGTNTGPGVAGTGGDIATGEGSVPVSAPMIALEHHRGNTEAEREREGERDGGAETEFEDAASGGGGTGGRRRRRSVGGQGMLVDLFEPFGGASESLEGGGGVGGVVVDGDGDEEVGRLRAEGDGSMGSSSRRARGEDSSEGERNGAIDGGVDGDGTVVGKRKR